MRLQRYMLRMYAQTHRARHHRPGGAEATIWSVDVTS